MHKSTTPAVILTFTMPKGGVGKTTSVLNVGVNLARRGKKVLLVDIDPQANLTQGLGVNLGGDDINILDKDEEKIPKHSIVEALFNTDLDPSYAMQEIDTNLHLIPARFDLAFVELELSGAIGREFLLREVLKHVLHRYDYIIIDSPPTLGLFTLNALMAAHSLIVTVQTQVYAYRSLPQFKWILKLIQKHNPGVSIGGIVLTQYDSRNKLSPAIVTRAQTNYPGLVFKTIIPINTKLAEAPAAGVSISEYAPKAAGAEAYGSLTDEIEARYAQK
jgi:chromosome partitioning protein